MAELLCVTWTLVRLETDEPSNAYPRAWRRCARCDGTVAFDCAGRFRVNAHRKRLDVWLIYRCSACGSTWNRPVHERRTKAEIGAAALQRMMANNVAEVAVQAGDAAALARHCDRVEAPAATLRKAIEGDAPSRPAAVHAHLSVPAGAAMRLDRVLAAGLSLPRASIAALMRSGALQLDPAHGGHLRRPARDGQKVRVELALCAPQDASRILAGILP
jgi:hypothetical protein